MGPGAGVRVGVGRGAETEGLGSRSRWRKPPEELLGVSWVSAGRQEEKQVRMNVASILGALTPRNCTLQGHDGKLRTHRHGSSEDSQCWTGDSLGIVADGPLAFQLDGGAMGVMSKYSRWSAEAALHPKAGGAGPSAVVPTAGPALLPAPGEAPLPPSARVLDVLRGIAEPCRF